METHTDLNVKLPPSAQAREVSSSAWLRAAFAALRPRQWTKNLIVFAGLVFALRLTDLSALSNALLTFAAFCCVSSAGYLVNDLRDVAADRQHPLKRLRPIARGIISMRQAGIMAGLLASVGLGLVWQVQGAIVLVVAAYLGLTLVYTVFLKDLVLIDLFVIAAGFVLRMVGGALAVGVRISPWLYVCTILVALFLGLAKRRQELSVLDQGARQHRKNLAEYSIDLVDQLSTIVTSAIVMAYALYTFSAPNLPDNDAMMLTIPLVLYGLFRYLYLVRVKGLGGSPEELLLTDRPLLVTAISWIGLSTVILYLLPRLGFA